MRTIGGIFGRSIFGPLHENMVKVQDCVALLVPIINAFNAREWDRVHNIAADIHQKEAEADAIKAEIRRALSRSFFTSVERSEMLLTLKALDDVSDNCDEVAKLLEIRHTKVVPAVAEDFVSAATQATNLVGMLANIVSNLTHLQDHEQPMLNVIVKLIDDLQQKKDEFDVLEQEALAEVFRHEQEVDPVSTLFLMQIVQYIGAVADSIENTADCIERVIGRR